MLEELYHLTLEEYLKNLAINIFIGSVVITIVHNLFNV